MTDSKMHCCGVYSLAHFTCKNGNGSSAFVTRVKAVAVVVGVNKKETGMLFYKYGAPCSRCQSFNYN